MGCQSQNIFIVTTTETTLLRSSEDLKLSASNEEQNHPESYIKCAVALLVVENA